MDSVEGFCSLEEIRQVKYRYLRCIDLKLWDEIAEVFTERATLDYGTIAYGKPLQITGRSEIVAFLRAKLGPDTLTTHAAGQPEITVDGDTATGIWSLQDTVLATRHRMLITGELPPMRPSDERVPSRRGIAARRGGIAARRGVWPGRGRCQA
jgi:hypothetical protein